MDRYMLYTIGAGMTAAVGLLTYAVTWLLRTVCRLNTRLTWLEWEVAQLKYDVKMAREELLTVREHEGEYGLENEGEGDE